MVKKDTEKSTACPHCGYQIKRDVEFCPQCGGKLTIVNYCPKCGAVPEKNEKYCSSCGENLINVQTITAQSVTKRPTGIVVLCVLWFLGGLYNVFAGLSTLASDVDVMTSESYYYDQELQSWLSWAIPTEAIIMVIVALLGIVQFVTIYGLWNGKSWSYKLGIATPIVGMFTNWAATLLIMTLPYGYSVDGGFNFVQSIGSVFIGIIYISYLRQAHVKKWLLVDKTSQIQ